MYCANVIVLPFYTADQCSDPIPTLLINRNNPQTCIFPSCIGFLGPTPLIAPNGISIESAVFAGFAFVTNGQTDRQTDRPTPHTYTNDGFDSLCVKRLLMFFAIFVSLPPGIL